MYLLPLSPYNKLEYLIQRTSYLFSSTIKPKPKPFQFSLKEKEIKNIKRSSQFEKKKRGSVQGFVWAERELEDCNVEGSLKEGGKNDEAFKYCVRKQRVWKLSTFLLYRFSVTAAYLISFLPLFLSTQWINTDRTCLLRLRYLYISICFFGCKTFMLCLY